MESQTAKISFKVDGELYERIAEHARAEGLPNMSAAIRDLIEIALDTRSAEAIMEHTGLSAKQVRAAWASCATRASSCR